ncbi:hypothetical protein ATANTOWER_001292 [Ataeniobius toweri]|uniref:Uncharacterized protein n=1 Tax=Ataeniobius toweri TaxID=208326 RepID=A0ABU7C2J8_9TELE|nr:hypothetical protein [Ataeniobius toweri]
MYANLPGGLRGRPAVERVSANEQSFRTGETGTETFSQSPLIPPIIPQTPTQENKMQTIAQSSLFYSFLTFSLQFLFPSYSKDLQSLVSLGRSRRDSPGPE